ncbi:heat shock 70 kDa protein 12A-like [Dreissena polymorpha]|uniref:heat shock 70 kDa protein 12A-like n=1 Tax=Dreissena polymorpha TaxID=45954 RepID=UPI002264AE7A|nr:heat shock 70 kDa protein 12A-like [Dreissena polymorpha]
MLLYDLNKNNLSTDVKTESLDGLPEDISTVMCLFIKVLKEDFLNKNKTLVTEGLINKTLWVVTVPALWSQKTNDFMRTAAETAGITNTNLLLASEPECAAVYCINLPQEQQINMGNLGMPGTKFLTADIGGNISFYVSF